MNETGAIAMTKGQRTAARLLDAAEALFASRGYNTTSLRDIAAAAGIQQPGLYKHFASKDDLYRQVCERALRPLVDVLDQALEGSVDMLVTNELTDRMTDILARHPHIARLLIRGLLTEEPDPVAMAWIGQLFDYGRRMTEKLRPGSEQTLLVLHISAVFNVTFGFFWASEIISQVLGHDASSSEVMAIQKDLLRRIIGSFSLP